MTQTPLSELNIPLPPTQWELPCDDGEPMETQRHQDQMTMLIHSLYPWIEQREDGYAGGNMFVYFSLEQVRNQDFKGPDFFAVLGVPKGERLSWVVWEEGKGPDVIIELLSSSTATVDKTEKKRIYQDQLRVPEYYWFDPFNPEDWEGFTLQNGEYQPIEREGDRMVSQTLGLSLVRWQGRYRDADTTWLRWATLEGDLFLLPQEQVEWERGRAEEERNRAEEERNRAEEERNRAEEERNRAEDAIANLQNCATQLLQTGMTPEQVAAMTGLSLEQVSEL
ncbi:Uma2 family endonuclease [Spirulina sp. CS-785/01]|uniref:Uma2 family endonuclease n=1 Tax=Spirulina sp. CS-785/01 TaxID=3021716 RepID=UPI00232C1D24|nr:Uma2 family endonuclease [Spirulina sp. CS-785/01]MDB9315571.1 Uma2 family endonuclease [Spirulina sp. CS-785/01]